MVKFTTLIPIYYNNGKQVEDKVFNNFDKELIRIAGGFTIEGITEGGWESEGKIYRDKSRKYTIATTEDKLEDLKDLLRKTGIKLKQKAIYYKISRKTEINFLEIE